MRSRLLTALFETTHRVYAHTKRDRTPWGLSASDLCALPSGTLGHALGGFLTERGFELMPRLELHDVMHLLSGVETDVVSEVELQAVLFGNGKRSPYLLGTLLVGSLVYPEHLGRFLAAVARGGSLTRFHDLDAWSALHRPLASVLPRPA